MSALAERSFLDVDASALGKRWRERLDARGANAALDIAQTLGVPDLVARVLAGRGVGVDDASTFLSPAIRNLMPDPHVLTDMEAAANRLADAVANGERVAVFGDYDVDGAAGAALMARFLAHHGTAHEIYIPDRVFEGYGPNAAALNELADRGATLIVTVDCGATSFEALAEAAARGVDVVVLDHHQMGPERPECLALVNPNRQDDLSGLGHLCAAGVVFMALVATQRVLRGRGATNARAPLDLLGLLDLVALATVCDVVPLVGLNRAFVVKGLQVLRTQANKGLAALARLARLGGPARPYHLGFVLGPRINAGGRIGDAALGAKILSSEDEAVAEQIAVQLEQLNRERQAGEKIMLEQAVAEADAEIGAGPGPAVLITESTEWHPGIVGLIASRLKERYRRPAIAIAFDGRGTGTGSGRSISGIDLGAAVRAAKEAGHLEKGGGHAMAAGITVRRDKLGELRAFFEEQLSERVTAMHAVDELAIDGALAAGAASFELVELLEKAGPYGAGHPEPVFAFPRHTIRYAEPVGADHLRLTLASADGARLQAIAFRVADTPLGKLLMESRGGQLHLAGSLEINLWRGQRQLQLRVIDAARPPQRP